MIEMKAKFKHTWIRVQDPPESVKFYTHVPGMNEVGRSKIEKVTGSFETLICLLRLTTGMLHKPLGFKLRRSWYSHAAERDFQTRHAAGRAINESQGKTRVVR
jgi:catechol 2,3-dioxygenase-like lactoylglutathione lyase family enzyme